MLFLSKFRINTYELLIDHHFFTNEYCKRGIKCPNALLEGHERPMREYRKTAYYFHDV